MELTPKELMKQYIDSQNFTSTTQIMQAMKELFRDAIQQVMESELDVELGYEKSERMSDSENDNLSKNYRNGYSKKTVKTQLGEIEVKVPRDRNGEYEPKIIGKYNRNADGMEEKILSLYACGMSQRDIAEQIKNLYDVEISPELVSKISEKIMPEVNDWQNRPLEEVYPFMFMDAIQRCIIHQIRYSTRFVSYKDIKALMADLKLVYTAVTEDEALNNLIRFKEKWSKSYPSCVKTWEDNWDILSTFFAYPAEIRKIIYTTNIIEGLNRQFRQITKNKPSFTNDESLRKMLYLASKNIVKRWTQRCRNWDVVLNYLKVMFEDKTA